MWYASGPLADSNDSAVAAIALAARRLGFGAAASIRGQRAAHVIHLRKTALFVAAAIHLVAAGIDELSATTRAFHHETSSAEMEQTARQPDVLTAQLTRISRNTSGTLGVWIVDVSSGRSTGLNENAWFPMMSAYKLPIAIHALRLAERRRIDLDSEITLLDEDRRPGLSPLSRAIEERGSQTRTLRDLLSSMMRISDNAASDKVLRLVGGPAAVMATLHDLRLDGISVNRYELEFAADYYGVRGAHRQHPFSLDRFAAAVDGVPEADRRRAAAAFLSDRRDTAQPRGFASLLTRLVKGELLDASDTAWLIAEMGEMHTRDMRLRAGLPPGTFAALRPGTSGETGGIRAAHNDNAIVTLPDGTRVVIAAFLKGSRGTDAQRDRTLAAVARVAYAWATEARSLQGRPGMQVFEYHP